MSHRSIAALILLSCVAITRADTLNWNNTGTDFNSAGSWTNANPLGQNRVPTLSDLANFNLPKVNDPVISASSSFAVLGLQFDTAGIGYTLSATNPNVFIATQSSGIKGNNVTGSNSITAGLLLNTDQAITQASGGTLNITGAVRLGGGVGTTNITIGSTGANGTINFNPSSAEIGNDINLVTNVNVSLPAVVSETAGAGITKSGSATLTMTGASTYDGTTTINAGTLLATNSSGSATGSGPVAVNNGATLGGNGSIAGAATVNAGGRITGGTAGTVNTLSLQSNLVFSGASGSRATYLVDLSGASSDRLAIGGILNLSGSYDSLLFSGSANGTSTYTLATYSSVSGIFDSVVNLPSGYTLSYGVTELDLVPLSAVPEPATWFAGALALACVALTKRQRLRALFG